MEEGGSYFDVMVSLYQFERTFKQRLGRFLPMRNQAGRIQLSKLCGRKELAYLKQNEQGIGYSRKNKPANVVSLYIYVTSLYVMPYFSQ